VSDQIWRHFYQHKFPINGQWLWLIAMVSSFVLYAVVSLLTGGTQKAANLEKILHRGKYAIAAEPSEARRPVRSLWLRLVGITEHFTLSDKILSIALVVWNIGWFVTFLAVTAYHFAFNTSDAWWAKFWHFYIISQFWVGVPSTIWFTIGGIHDIRALFKTLAHLVRDDSDDGTVHHEADDEIIETPPGISRSSSGLLKPALDEERAEEVE
jgi:solute:Na+ symporter, SSS family